MLGKTTSLKTWLMTLAVGALVILFIYQYPSDPKPRQLKPPTTPQVSVDAIAIESHEIPVRARGNARSAIDIELISEVSGRVIDVSEKFSEGGAFLEGEVLAKIDNSDYVAALAQAKANVANAERSLAEEYGLARQAKREWRDLNSEEANALFLRKPQIAAAKAHLESTKAALAIAELDLAKTEITAPFSAQILNRHVNLGEFVNAGSSIARVFSDEAAEVRVPFSNRQFPHAQDLIGAKIIAERIGYEISSKAQQSAQQWTGVITSIESNVDSSTKQRIAIAKFSDGFKSKSPMAVDEFLALRIANGKRQPSLKIQRNMLRQPQSVWLVDNNNQIRVIAVNVLFSDSKIALVNFDHSKLSDKDQLLVSEIETKTSFARVVIDDLSLAYSGMQVELR